ncbi:hypothetical protein [Mycobacterium stomatepiae]|uniref:Serine/threonine-protein kinase PknD n=1 Tax=Mycobacterium stomatepiae TaxID=470076 RepID=A0A7I7QIB9_9MYCO|nr:hypothetical protein [Mycobacterium stomatepiae]MCV7166133.1 hypothetical protein [Mycobacterium stomatepiae]BBY25686.1 hypothetical protein MSTO_58910 [Mycobacterium stomatepiae]
MTKTARLLPFADLKLLPTDLAVDPSGNVYVIDLGTIRVLKLDAGASAPIVLPFNDLKDSSSVAVDSKGNVYLNDGLHFRILKLAVQS